ncbi:hypothetical protein TNIN_43371 [Trichonephila inaurata madagascariensis]|uniref:Uncharacterized protein n=1 Tax=Trichonephila inaurata madagascariensis TaxID=2747483 RepID=A0A8X6YSC9_9ARAC|nr:hypothetical protein TNIN_43371 [Trichonephila inaurata madagascariensis]
MTKRATLSKSRLQIILGRPRGHDSRGINRGIHLSTRITRMGKHLHPRTQNPVRVADVSDTICQIHSLALFHRLAQQQLWVKDCCLFFNWGWGPMGNADKDYIVWFVGGRIGKPI